MKFCRRIDDPVLGMMLGFVLADRVVAVWITGGETRPDVTGDTLLRRLGFTWMDVSGAVASSR